MNVDVVPASVLDLSMMRDLGELAQELVAGDIPARSVQAQLPGVKDSGLAVAISIGGMLLSSLSTFVSVLSYWSSRKPKYSLTLQAGDTTLQVSDLDKQGAREVVQRLQQQGGAQGVIVRVTQR